MIGFRGVRNILAIAPVACALASLPALGAVPVATAAAATVPRAANSGSNTAAEKPGVTANAWSGTKWGDKSADAISKDLHGKYDPAKDPGSLFTITNAIGARNL